jgi:hypothetical protein
MVIKRNKQKYTGEGNVFLGTTPTPNRPKREIKKTHIL